MNITERLFLLSDSVYRDFQASLMPTVDKARIIGVRTPHLRKLVRELKGTDEAALFISQLPHKYYEENNLHAFLIEQISDINTALKETERFLPYIDNWATCDAFTPKAFKKDPEACLPCVYRWIASDNTYTVRYAIKLLMTLFLGERFIECYMQTVSEVKNEDYYVNMAIAWYFATALDKQYEFAIRYIENGVLPVWVHNKAIQKAVESYRISPEIKNYLKTLRIK